MLRNIQEKHGIGRIVVEKDYLVMLKLVDGALANRTYACRCEQFTSDSKGNTIEITPAAKSKSFSIDKEKTTDPLIRKRVSENAEGVAVPVGLLPELEKPASTFVRLAEGKLIQHFLENTIAITPAAKSKSFSIDKEKTTDPLIHKRVSENAEGVAVLVGLLPELEKPASTFVRLAEGKLIQHFLENTIAITPAAKSKSFSIDKEKTTDPLIHKRVSENAEGVAVLVGLLPELEKPASTFVRLAEGKLIQHFLEITKDAAVELAINTVQQNSDRWAEERQKRITSSVFI